MENVHQTWKTMYYYGLLRLDVSPEADAHNNVLLRRDTLGIEVTSHVFAQRCGLGNVDPQHPDGGVGGRSSAIEEVMKIPLPPTGSMLVTSRLDKDSIGAMAVLSLRQEGKVHKINQLLVEWVGTLDLMGYHNARVARPDLDELFSREVTDALNIVAKNDMPYASMIEKVEVFKQILCGELSEQDLLDICMMAPRRGLINYVEEKHEGFAFVKAYRSLREARNKAGKLHNVAVIFDPQSETAEGSYVKRYSIICREGYLDRKGFEDAINVAEAGARGITVEKLRAQGLTWGGTRAIVSSPQGSGRATRLNKTQVLTVLQVHLLILQTK